MSNLFELLKDNKNLKKTIFSIEVSKKIKENWETIFGKLSTDLQFEYIKGNDLYISAMNYLWISEINYYKKGIIEKVNAIITKKFIFDIKVSHRKDLKEENQKHSLKIPSKSLGLEEKIIFNNKQKLKNGYKLCDSCSQLLTKEPICFLCQQKESVVK
ncbi:MAG: DciA family protein [Candidatus Margulisiibacteriota bacterium]|jgi:hypothetical protein